MLSKNKDLIKWSIGISLILFLWLSGTHRSLIAEVQRLVLFTGLIQPVMSLEESEPSGQLPELTLTNEEGERISLSQFRGKAIFLNIWASWCPPCKAEMPGIQSLYEDVGEEEVHFVMISVDHHFETARRFKEQEGLTFPIYHLEGHFPPLLQGRSIPRTYLIDAQGALRMQHDGMADYDTRKFRAYLRQMTNIGKDASPVSRSQD